MERATTKPSVHFMSRSSEWETPQALFDSLNAEFGLEIDVCATHENAKLPKFYTKEFDGLQASWKGARAWMNPPYGREIGKWVEKAYAGGADIVVALLPARTDTKWFWDFIYQKPNVQIRFIRGRLKFGGSKNSAPFPSMVVVFTSLLAKEK